MKVIKLDKNGESVVEDIVGEALLHKDDLNLIVPIAKFLIWVISPDHEAAKKATRAIEERLK